MTTQDILNIALQEAGLDTLPEDSGVFVEKDEVKKVLVGVDLEGTEVLLARELGCDAAISHHPHAGTAVTEFHKVMLRQIDRMVAFGVPINKAQKVLKKRVAQVDLSHHVANHDRAGSAARLLGLGYMNVHMPADLITERFVQSHLDGWFAERPKGTLKELLDALNAVPEYAASIVKPVIRVGGEQDYCGKIAVLMAGGTGGGPDVFKAYFEAGVGTIVCMHVAEDVKKAVEEQGIGNVVVAGHMPSDSIGINKLIAAWREAGLEVIPCCGVVADDN